MSDLAQRGMTEADVNYRQLFERSMAEIQDLYAILKLNGISWNREIAYRLRDEHPECYFGRPPEARHSETD